MEWKVGVQYSFERDVHEVYLYQRLPSGNRLFITEGGQEKMAVGPETAVTGSLAFAMLDEAQMHALANSLAEAGIKTKPIHQLEGTLAAQSLHLEDMRRLVFEPTLEVIQDKAPELKEVVGRKR
jgi:hypothetical protein